MQGPDKRAPWMQTCIGQLRWERRNRPKTAQRRCQQVPHGGKTGGGCVWDNARPPGRPPGGIPICPLCAGAFGWQKQDAASRALETSGGAVNFRQASVGTDEFLCRFVERSEHGKQPCEFRAGLNLAVFLRGSTCHVGCRVRRLAGGPGDAQSPWGRLRAAKRRGGAAPKKSESPRRYWRRAVRPKAPPRRPC